MTTAASMSRTPFDLTSTVANACPSSWFSWTCYWSVVGLSLTPSMQHEILAGGTALWVLLAGVGVFFASVVAIQRHMRLALSATSYGTPSRLVTSGPFRYSRNPIYVAFLVPLASLAYLSPIAAAAATIAYLLVMTRVVIRAEEKVLEAQFGSQFLDYKKTAPRWIF